MFTKFKMNGSSVEANKTEINSFKFWHEKKLLFVLTDT